MTIDSKTMKDIQLFIIRIYLGLDFLGHFPEKFGWLGPAKYQAVLDYFTHVMPYPQSMLLLAGLCELGACIGLTLGLFTRVAALGSALYLVISLFAGHHHVIGFTWIKPGGGWEFAAMWAVLCASFVLTGGGRWSVDHWIARIRTSMASTRLDQQHAV